LAVGVVFTSWTGQISIFLEGQVRALAKVLREVPLVVGYNLDRFDLEVLRGYPGVALKNVSTFDLMNVVQMEAERRISLDALAQANFDIAPWSGSKLIERWKRGDSRAVIEACVNHALIIDRLFRKVLNDGELSVPNGPGKTECISIRAPTFAEKAS
jgi:DEAD/DEAH box helicase domain-containing protein